MKKCVRMICVVLCFMGILNGCATDTTPTELTLPHSTTYPLQTSGSSSESDPTSQTVSSNTSPSINGATWDEELDFGKLVYTVTGARVITNCTDIPTGNFRYDAEVSVKSSTGEVVRARYPDFIKDNGEFSDDVNLILLDITVQSHDATNRMVHPENGEVYWLYENQYIFRADAILCLIDKTETSGSFYRYYDPVFFSLWGEYNEHPTAYELLPGETISFTVGYLIGTTSHGEPRDMNQLVASVSWGSLDKLYIELNLGDK